MKKIWNLQMYSIVLNLSVLCVACRDYAAFVYIFMVIGCVAAYYCCLGAGDQIWRLNHLFK